MGPAPGFACLVSAAVAPSMPKQEAIHIDSAYLLLLQLCILGVRPQMIGEDQQPKQLKSLSVLL